MQTNTAAIQASKKRSWWGLIISAIIVLFLLFDSIIKLLNIDPVLQTFAQLGYPTSLARTIGLTELVCIVLYVIPRTSVLGAILLTGFLGGATATKARFEDPWFLFSIAIGILIWLGIFLRDERLRTLIPFRK